VFNLCANSGQAVVASIAKCGGRHAGHYQRFGCANGGTRQKLFGIRMEVERPMRDFFQIGESTRSRRRSRLNCGTDLRRDHGGIAPDITFPDANDSPTERSQNTRHLPVPLTIPFDLRNPIWRIPTFSELALPLRPLTPMPKITVAEDHDTVSRDHQVGTAGQCGRVQPIPNSGGPKSLSQQDFRSGILMRIAGAHSARLGATRTVVLVPRH
jgi:hypothetical protein